MKYEFTGEVKVSYGRTLHQIRAKISFGNIAKGDIGGWIESEKNLSQEGNAWVFDNAEVYGNARVSGNASIMWISNIGSRSDTTTFFLGKKKEIIVNCGCFHGTIEQFREAVEKEHGDNLHGKMYRLAIEMAKLKLQSAANEPPEEEADAHD